jgi:hypothetical protein
VTNKPIPVELSRIKTAGNEEQLVPKVTLGDFATRGSSQPDMRGQLNAFAARYQEMIDRCKMKLDIVAQQKTKKRGIDPLLFWEIGDYILQYLQEERSLGEFALNDIYAHLSRDLSLSTSSLEKILTFRRRFATKNSVDSGKGWTYYRGAMYRKPVSVSKASEQKRSAVVMLRLKVPTDVSLEGLDSQLRRWIHGEKGTSPSLTKLLHQSGIELDSCEVFYGKEAQGER